MIWHFGPDLKVSMDGRRETVYSPAVVDAHMRFYAGGPGAVQYAEDLRPDYILIPAALPVVEELVSHGWRSACRGPTSVLLTRRDVVPCDARAEPRVRFFPSCGRRAPRTRGYADNYFLIRYPCNPRRYSCNRGSRSRPVTGAAKGARSRRG